MSPPMLKPLKQLKNRRLTRSKHLNEDNLYISNAGSNGQFLSKQSGNNGGLTWADAGGGITEADQWRLTSDQAGTITTVNAWERNDTTGATYIGTGLTNSSGIFSFASNAFNSRVVIVFTTCF